MAPTRKTMIQIAKMRESGLIAWKAQQAAAAAIKVGVTTAEIDAVVEKVIAAHNAQPLFKGHRGSATSPFPAATCISINDEVVHGIPGSRKLSEGDIVSIDIGVRLDGWCSDTAMTWPVGEIDSQTKRLLQVTAGALNLAIAKSRPNIQWSKVATAIESHVKRAGFYLIEDLCGHGIGRQLWEEPQVPNHFCPIGRDFKLHPGTVIAVEPMVALGSGAVQLQPDGWTMVTADRTNAAHFEHTIAVTEDAILVLTGPPSKREQEALSLYSAPIAVR